MSEGSLSVQGRGQVSAEPDLAVISFDVRGRAWEYGEAIDDLNEKVEALRGDLEQAKIARETLKTRDFSIDAEHRYEDDERIFNGYEARHQLAVEVENDRETLNEVLNAVTRGHSDAAFSLSFGVKDGQALRQRMLAEAVADTRRNAQTLAEAAGVQLGEIRSIDYGWTEVRFHTDAMYEMSGPEPSGSPLPDLEPSEITAEDTVTVVWGIREAG